MFSLDFLIFRKSGTCLVLDQGSCAGLRRQYIDGLLANPHRVIPKANSWLLSHCKPGLIHKLYELTLEQIIQYWNKKMAT